MGKGASEIIILPETHEWEETVCLDILRKCGGYYSCPIDPETGKPFGPLVGYSGRYGDPIIAGKVKQYVGFKYFNFARTEQYPHVTDFFAEGLQNRLGDALGDEVLESVNCIVGIPEGGKSLGIFLAYNGDVMYAGLEKKVLKLATAESKEETALVLGRHDLPDGAKVLLCEDLTNNFSTADKAIEVVEKAGGQVLGFVCALNRSSQTEYKGLPVISLVYSPTAQFMQDAPEVVQYLEDPGVVWDVKPNWARLEEAMQAAQDRGIEII